MATLSILLNFRQSRPVSRLFNDTSLVWIRDLEPEWGQRSWIGNIFWHEFKSEIPIAHRLQPCNIDNVDPINTFECSTISHWFSPFQWHLTCWNPRPRTWMRAEELNCQYILVRSQIWNSHCETSIDIHQIVDITGPSFLKVSSLACARPFPLVLLSFGFYLSCILLQLLLLVAALHICLLHCHQCSTVMVTVMCVTGNHFWIENHGGAIGDLA